MNSCRRVNSDVGWLLFAMRQILILGFAVGLVLVTSTVYAQKDSTDSSRCSIHEKTSEGWERYYLAGPGGDAICVYLPGKPEKFAGGKLRGGQTPVTADVYLFAKCIRLFSCMTCL